MSSHHQTIEHIVLMNVKPDADSTKVAIMIDESNKLASLNLTVHLSAGKLLQCTTSTSLNFSHILHCRFSSKDDLQTYYAHPEHLRVVGEYIQPVVDDVMIVDWISNGLEDSLKPGSVMRVMLLKLKEDGKMVEVMEGIKSGLKTTGQISVGENFSPEMAKGYSIAVITVFPDLQAVVDSDADLENLHRLKVKDFIESEVVVDYVTPLL